jgi:hypothetical protein
VKTIALLFLASCGIQTTQTISPHPGARELDIAVLKTAIEDANRAAGCEIFRYDPGASPNFGFDYNTGCKGEFAPNTDGKTTVNPILPPKMCAFSVPDSSQAHYFEAVYLHEIGHAAGLDHVADRQEIMFAWTPHEWDNDALEHYIQAIVGAGNKCL